MQRLVEYVKTVIGLVAQAINNTNVTGVYYHVGMGQRVRAWLNGGAMAATKTTKVELLQATTAAGGGAKAITSADATITANTLVTRALVALASVGTGDTVTINGLVFTCGSPTAVATRTFANAAGLETCVEDATYGVPGVKASVASTDVTLYADPAGDTTLTVVGANVGGTVTVSTVEAQAYVDLDVSQLDLANGFEYIAAKVTTTANTVAAVTLDFYDQRFAPTQKVGAAAVV